MAVRGGLESKEAERKRKKEDWIKKQSILSELNQLYGNFVGFNWTKRISLKRVCEALGEIHWT